MNTPLKLQGRVESARLSDAVYETLLEAIISGRLHAGAIVSEVSLAKQLEVSRTPVHDAMRQLAKDGLVEQRAGRRAVITTFNRDDLYDIFEMRKLLEGEAAKRAANRIEHASLASLRSVGESLKNYSDSAEYIARWADFDEEFHESIAKASGSPRLWQDIVRYRLLHRGFNKLATTVDGLQTALREHLQILDALEKRDGNTASRLMVDHIQAWQTYFVNHMPTQA
ncbi:MAG: GntR family transcriptional regulator [Planctomycetes bacterium]|nr:GntR family transcriptional regulator [Planctomycetota bacterium]